jgi:hypothetical protein
VECYPPGLPCLLFRTGKAAEALSDGVLIDASEMARAAGTRKAPKPARIVLAARAACRNNGKQAAAAGQRRGPV